jgi:hypothetical protein
MLFGLSVLLLADVCRRGWGPWGTALHVAFGALMTAAAAFSHRPWQAGVPFDRTEDLLHSVAATGMGLAFAAGVVAVALERARRRRGLRVLDVMAVAAAVAIPLAMSAASSAGGLLQRLMFAVAYAWYVAEAVRARQPRSVAAGTEAAGRRVGEPTRPGAEGEPRTKDEEFTRRCARPAAAAVRLRGAAVVPCWGVIRH